MIRRIKIKHLSDFGRVLDVRTDRLGFSTPTRGMMSSEFNKYVSLSKYIAPGSWNLDTLPNPLHELVIDYGNTELDRLSRNNGYFKQQQSRIRRNTRANSKRLTYVFFQLRNGTRSLTDRDIRALVDLQLSSKNLDLVCVPDPNPESTELSSLKRALIIAQSRLGRQAEDSFRIVPYLDLRTDYTYLRQRLEYLADDYPMIGIRFRNVYPSRYAVRDVIADKDVLIQLSGTQKHHSQQIRTVPTIHIMPIDFFDSISSFKRAGFPQPEISKDAVFREPKPRKGDPLSRSMRAAAKSAIPFIEKQYYFDPSPLGYYTPSQHKTEHGGTISCNCPLCSDKSIDDFFGEYYYHRGSPNPDKLKSHLTAHELISSFNEFERSQKEIEQSSYKDYLYSKPAIVSHMDYLPEMSSRSLEEFI